MDPSRDLENKVEKITYIHPEGLCILLLKVKEM